MQAAVTSTLDGTHLLQKDQAIRLAGLLVQVRYGQHDPTKHKVLLYLPPLVCLCGGGGRTRAPQSKPRSADATLFHGQIRVECRPAFWMISQPSSPKFMPLLVESRLKCLNNTELHQI